MLLPLSFNLEGRKILLIGGGRAAAEKFAQLKRTPCQLTIVSPEIGAHLERQLAEPAVARIDIERRKFADADLDGVFMAFSAVADDAVSAHIFRLCRERNILINSADDKTRCDFYTNAIVERGSVQLAVSTGGRFAGLAAILRRHLDAILPEELDGDWEKIFALREKTLTLQSVIEKKSVITNIVKTIEERYFQRNSNE